MSKQKQAPAAILTARKVNHEYLVEDTLKAGVKLEGWMVKAIRAGRIASSGIPFVLIRNNEVSVVGLNISALEQANSFSEHKTEAPIKLLLNKREISRLSEAQQQKGYTIVLRKLFWERHLVKAEICLCKGKQLHDKRQTLKDRDDKLDSARAIKQANH
jgi:SsrA-binding protein